MSKVNPVRELRSLTVCANSGFFSEGESASGGKPPLASSGNDRRLDPSLIRYRKVYPCGIKIGGFL